MKEFLNAAKPAYNEGRKAVMAAISQSPGESNSDIENAIVDLKSGDNLIQMLATPTSLISAVFHF